MSLILEALKKSEQQRQRERAPNLQSIHQPAPVAARRTNKPLWLLAAAILLGNAGFLAYWFVRHESPAPAPQPIPASAPIAQTPPVAAAQQAEPEPAPEFTQFSPRGQSPQPLSTASTQPVEELSELPDDVRNNLPAMTFSFHVYSETPEQRTIIINDRRVREGDQISPGLILQSITPDGVILWFAQHRIHISVLSEW